MPKPFKVEEERLISELAQRVARQVLHFIDGHYPELWVGAPRTARLALRGTVRLETTKALQDLLIGLEGHTQAEEP